MNSPNSLDFECLVADAVINFMQARGVPSLTVRSVRLPITIRNNADLAELVRWTQLLFTCDALRESFKSGVIQLDLELAIEPTAAPMPVVSHELNNGTQPQRTRVASPKMIDESVITESVLRRQQADGQVVKLRHGAVITPAARDYARSAGIRMER